MPHIPSSTTADDRTILAQKIAAIIRAYGTNGKYISNDIYLTTETIPNVHKIMVWYNTDDPAWGVLAFMHRFVEGQGAQGETVIHRPNDRRWRLFVENLFPSAQKVLRSQ